MAKAKRPSLSSSSNPDPAPELMMELLEEEEGEEAFKICIEAIIQQHLQTLNQSYNRIEKLLLQTSLIHSYKRLGKIHEVENDHVVFDDSSDALQKDIESSIQVAQNITTIFKSILPRHTLDYVSNKKKFFLVNFSKSENLKVSKFEKKTDFVRNKIVDLAVKLYNLRTSRIQSSIVESVQYRQFRKYGTKEKVDFSILAILTNKDCWENNKKVIIELEMRRSYRDRDFCWEKWAMKQKKIITEIITERDEIMIKIEKAMKDLEGILFGIYVMLQTQIAISAYAISDDESKWFGTGHHYDIESLATAAAKEEEMRKKKNKTLWAVRWFKSKIISFTEDIESLLASSLRRRRSS